MIGILNYGSGNIQAIKNILKILNLEFMFVDDKNEFSKISKIILPGVGSFDFVMSELNKSGLKDKLNEFVLLKKKPVLGICVGMQIMGNFSDEGNLKGLGWIDGNIKKFPKSEKIKPSYPHMGWNRVKTNDNTLFHDINKSLGFYFVHSYYFNCQSNKNILSSTKYHFDFTSSIKLNNIYGVQFHPEKSHGNGMKIFKNFSKID
tara:strand:+ start:194 stop:805 length:612 start_codon:yes stop_codon:yes gene_type:complete